VVLGVLGNPRADQQLDGFHGLAGLRLGIHPAEKTTHIGLRGLEHSGWL